jgi:hypothetical protein
MSRIVVLLLVVGVLLGVVVFSIVGSGVSSASRAASGNVSPNPPSGNGNSKVAPPIPSGGKIARDVWAALQNSPDGTVCVIVAMRQVQGGTFEENMAAVKESEDRVLARLSPDEFRDPIRYRTFAGLAGYANAAGLAKLAASPEVVGIGLNRRSETQSGV